MKHLKLKKLIATALVITTTITSVNMTALADVSDTGGNTSLTGGGPASGDGTTGMFFETLQSGYRIYIIDENGNRVSNTIDICYGKPSELVTSNNMYTNAYNEGLSKDKSNYKWFTWEEIQKIVPSLAGHIPTAPLTRNSVNDPFYLAHGIEFKQWVINGIGGETLTSVMGELAADTSNSNPFRNTSSGGSGSNTSSSLTGGTGGSTGSSTGGTGSSGGVTAGGATAGVDAIFISSLQTTTGRVSYRAQYGNGGAAYSAGLVYATILRATFILQPGSSTAQKRAKMAVAIYQYLRANGYSPENSAGAAATIAIEVRLTASAENTNSNVMLASNNSGTIESLGLGQIVPTANSSGYLVDLLNAKHGENRLFYFTNGVKIPEGGGVVSTIANKGYYIAVEPVFWTRYTTTNNGVDSFYTYGSYRNLVQYYNDVKGYRNSGPNNRQLMTGGGWRSLTLGKSITFKNGTTLVPAVNDEKYKAIGTLADTRLNIGYALHIYASEGGAYTKTRSDGTMVAKGAEHPAPVPEDTSSYDEKINIVKTYQHSEDGGVTYKHNNTYVSSDEPSTVYVLNEEGWETVEWYVSSKAKDIKSTTEWDEMKKAVFGVHSQYGDASTVTADNWTNNKDIPSTPGLEVNVPGDCDNNTTLYILFRKKNNVDLTNADITESQISAIKKFDTASTSANNVEAGNYNNIILGKYAETQKNVPNGAANQFIYTLFRGDDKLTLASISGLNADKENGTLDYVNNFSIGGTRGLGRQTSDYSADYLLALEGTEAVPSNAVVDVYTGKETGIDTQCNQEADTNKARVSSGVRIDFNPIIWMTTAFIGTNNEQVDTVNNVLSEHTRTIIPNDYAEVYVKEKGEIAVTSNMWATDKKIQDLTGGANNALKGGATYYVETPTTAKVNIETYQTVVDGIDVENYRTTLTDGEATHALTVAEAEVEHAILAGQVEENIGLNYSLKQYVNKEGKSDVPTSSSKTKEVTAGCALTWLNGISTASTEDKYYLRDGSADFANTTSLEAAATGHAKKFYRFLSLPNGDIYMLTGDNYSDTQNKAIEIIEYVKANNGIDDKYTSNRILKKGQGVSELTNSDAKKINSKTNILDKMLATLERNTGDDKNANWASDDGKWYNEGCLGFTIEREVTQIEVGMLSITKRQTVLDPKLCPKQEGGKSEQNTKVFSSKYVATYNGAGGTLGTFHVGRNANNTDTSLALGTDALKKLFNSSNTFYIPNSTVTDNK